MRSIIYYIREFLRPEWLKKFFFAKTAPLVTPPYFKDYPSLTGKECTGCFSCMMICPAPGGIEVLRQKDRWEPEIYPGHCIRCGLCVEACPEDVLTSGRVLDVTRHDRTAFRSWYHLEVDNTLCMRCGNCCVSCPINKQEDPQLGATGTSSSDEVIMRIEDGRVQILHEEKCTGCKTCETNCPNQAIRVARMVEGVHEEVEA
ncbi:MAG TPA: 4Fe-4S dicluster domain-containing protein [Candidatus Methanoculleus thermohydrogenotrophicum]|jgi:energy-converting hydrogenase A subunit P|nr:4Fe-4S dicluster domain-containing protein [Candidatus Methanoculleus thermohydrogenotrophicum]NLM82778.1 4Fe-4S dicluster domain-containing protein [Candidatus Methanoculleus thermohydrogenotrophicum]HOB18039.1 4Fe-4S dicluster domain-containing protein [Candidatus Methanoculleus thermohydrogenotrophicum]HPZ38135.1 4Fe-4S dicluster domain-containing protein [Candidatus Methanoculleus thermohydrogenotrophicum]HQC91007.1 4Fe-4S dicluster domain-containing protein [Candidatus Methanoculleus th